MYINSDIKKELFAAHSPAKTATDTGSPESQVALFSYRIKSLTEHLKTHPKDISTRVGLTKLVGKRKRLLNYLMRTDINRYRSIIKELGIRK